MKRARGGAARRKCERFQMIRLAMLSVRGTGGWVDRPVLSVDWRNQLRKHQRVSTRVPYQHLQRGRRKAARVLAEKLTRYWVLG